MMSKKLVALLLAVLATAVASASAQVVIGDFEGGSLDGWTGQNGTTVGSYTNAFIGAQVSSTGQSALNVYNGNAAGGFRWSARLDNNAVPNLAALLLANPILKMDVTWVTAEWQPAPPSGNDWARWDAVAINSGAGWKQSSDANMVDSVNPSFPGSWDATNYGAVHQRTLTYNLNQISGWGVASDFTQLWLSVNYSGGYSAGVGGSFYVDNIRLCPEPASLGLAGVALVGLALRRRSA
jgi:hypothetical protein